MRRAFGAVWPWLAFLSSVGVAVWYLVYFPTEIDPEFPTVERPTFSPWPPPAYRIAEPGDTLDHVALYLSAWGAGIAGMSWFAAHRRGGGPRLWPTALALSLASAWYAAAPGPTFDGWHGLGWRSVLNPALPIVPKATLLLAGLALTALGWWAVRREWRSLGERLQTARIQGALPFLILATVLVPLRQADLSGFGPIGFWPRWAHVLGLLAFDLALWKLRPDVRWRGRDLVVRLSAISCMLGLIWAGLWVSWYHRPIERFKAIIPGRLYISAMPSPDGLAIAHERHHFKTIVNLFPEDLDEHPDFAAERRFAEEHGIQYALNDNDAERADAFLDHTLSLARDPEAWPVLVHCHACMDRTPAWLGIYRFVVQDWPLLDALREIEQHRGLRPKASVFLLYNWNLPRLAPVRHAQDPTAPVIDECSQHQRLAPAAYMRIAGDVRKR